MTKRNRTALIGGVVITALLLLGAGFPTKKTPPSEWATGVCTAVNNWVTATKAGATALNADLTALGSPDALTGTGTQPTIRDVRELLAGYLGDTAHATTLALDGLDEAGVPATPKGTKAAATLTKVFKNIRKSLRRLHDDAEDLSTKNEKKALKQLETLNRQVSIEFGKATAALAKLRKLDPNHKLRDAFQADAVCQSL